MVQRICVKYHRRRSSIWLFPLLFFMLSNLSLVPLAAQTMAKTVVKTVAQTVTPINIDNNFDDWQSIKPLATFSINYSPVYFQQEKAGRTITLDIEEAQFWKRAGTLLKTIKAQKVIDTLYLYVESHSNFAENFSVFLYLFKVRKQKEENTCTLEIVPVTGKKDEGLILLWKKGAAKPRRCGHLAASDFQLELSLPLKDLPSEYQKDFAKLSFDVSTCYQQKTGSYEDYFFTTIYAKDIQ